MAELIKPFGPDSRQEQKPRATNGGQCDPKDMPYDKPVGPTSQMQQGPGLHGTNHGSCGSQGKR